MDRTNAEGLVWGLGSEVMAERGVNTCCTAVCPATAAAAIGGGMGAPRGARGSRVGTCIPVRTNCRQEDRRMDTVSFSVAASCFLSLSSPDTL